MTPVRDVRRAAALVALGLTTAAGDRPEDFWDSVLQKRTFFRPAQAEDFGADPSLFLQTGAPAPDKAYSLIGAWRPRQPEDQQKLAQLRLPASFDPAEADQSLAMWLTAVQGAVAQADLSSHCPGRVGVAAGHAILPTSAMAEATVSFYGREGTRAWAFNPFAPPPRTNPFRAVGYSAKLAAETFGFAGPAFTVDAACASSLYALKLALDKLRDGSLTAVVTGGLAKANPLFTQLGFSQLRALSRRGLSRPFDAQADGLVVGSGAVALILKRLDRALADGDDVICLVTGVGLANDQSGTFLAPDAAGQIRAMGLAFDDAGLPDDLAPDLIEAHGTATPLGDAAEVKALKTFLAGRRTSGDGRRGSRRDPTDGEAAGRPPALGSIKGNLGHLLSAAGAVSLAKVAWGLKTKVLPPTAGYERAAPDLRLDEAPALEVLTEARPWPEPGPGLARLAVVDAFGFGGVNAQAVLEEYRPELWTDGAAGRTRTALKKPDRALGAGPGRSEADCLEDDAAAETPLGEDRALSALTLAAAGLDLKRAVRDHAKAAQSLADAAEAGPADQPDASSASPSSSASSAASARSRSPQPSPTSLPMSAALLSARTVLAPWDTYDALARYWLTPEEPPMIHNRRLGGLKATGFFFESLALDCRNLHLPPKELAEALPQQTLALRASLAALSAAGLDPANWPAGLDRRRVGVFMGVDIDPRSSDFALRWLAPPRALQALADRDLTPPGGEAGFTEAMRAGSPPPLTHNRVLGALGSFVASRLSRHLGAGGPAFTLSEEKDSGLRALREAMAFLASGEVDLAVVGVVDTFGDPKTAALAPKTVWVEGAAALVLASPRAAAVVQPLAQLTLTDGEARLGPLSGLFALNRSAFYLRHRLKSLGRGHGFAYWLKSPSEPPRRLDGPGFALVETPGALPLPLLVHTDPVRPDVWFFLKAAGPDQLKSRLTELAAFLEARPGRDAHSSARDFWLLHLDDPEPPAMAILARDAREAAACIKRALADEEDRDLKPRILRAPPAKLEGELAWVFPGAGNHYKGLGRGLAVSFPHLTASLEAASDDPAALFQNDLFWEPNHKRPTIREALLGQVVFGLLGARALEQLDLRPQAALGHSLGETAALVAVGVWPDRDELRRDLLESTLFNGDLTGELTALRAYWNWPAHKPLKWTTALLPRSESETRAAIEGLLPPHRHRVNLLMVNAPEEVLVGGEETAAAALAAALETPFFPVEDVPAVHGPMVGPVANKYRQFHRRKTRPTPGVRFYSGASAQPVELESEALAEALTNLALHGCRFPDLVERAYADGVRFFIEVGPGSSATRLIKTILGERPHVAQSLAPTAVDEGWSGLNRVVAELWLAGYPLAPERCMLQPAPTPDPRYEVPIVFAPHELNWPVPEQAPEAPQTGPPVEDYLSWLDQQTGGVPRTHAGGPAGGAGQAGAGQAGAGALAAGQAAPPASGQAAPEASDRTAGRTTGQTADPGAQAPAPADGETGETAETGGKAAGGAPASRRRVKVRSAKTPTDAASQAGSAPASTPGDRPIIWTRSDCLEFAVGAAANVLGPDFAELDSLPSRVRLPDEPLMFVDRVTVLEGQPRSLAPGRIVTEHDVGADEWCVEDGRLTPGMTIESGQADMLLSAWLGVDFASQGLSRYRLLDAQVVFNGDTPAAGETASYDIRITSFVTRPQAPMFRFEFDGAVGGRPLLSMRQGCAGFFAPEDLAAGKGLSASQPAAQGLTANLHPRCDFAAGLTTAASLSADDLTALRAGDPGPLGPDFGTADLARPLLLPGGRLALIDRAPLVDQAGGAYGAGFIRAEAAVDPQAWYLTTHFRGDEVMPGTLMYDGCLQTLRLLLLTRGWLGEASRTAWQPPLGLEQALKCRGQVTPAVSAVAYEVHLRETGLATSADGRPEPYAVADAIMWADGRPVVEVKNLGLRLAGASVDELSRRRPAKKGQRRRVTTPAAAKGAAKAGVADAANAPALPKIQGDSSDEAPPASGPASDSAAAPVRSASPLSVRRSAAPKEIFDKAKLVEMSTGLMSKALGPLYARYDDGAFVARLPRAPYDYVDEVTVKKGRLGQVVIGSQVEAVWRLDGPDRLALWSEAGGQAPPYAALNEMALQPCGFLAAFMGSALPFAGPMHFRNLGGEALLRSRPDQVKLLKPGAEIRTKASLTKSSVLGAMTIQHYQFSCLFEGRAFYEGQTHFGFHSPESLAGQSGLKAAPALLKALARPEPAWQAYPEGPAWPRGRMRLLDRHQTDPKSPGRLWAAARVDPAAWFFRAHFPGDPVQPGSLGLETFLQAAKLLAALTFRPDQPLDELQASWAAPLADVRHRWLYRGQIVPNNRDAVLGLKTTFVQGALRCLGFKGLLWIDNLPVYQVDDFSVGLIDV
ncbi:MAG: hypothetical protein LBU12_08285 [Deltaproteobacteria bacterium]|jgi:acyl transferase domain-containing protein/3-hydroxymyristoyl/3-hydroxydecanoyl-(acyl carrier protein) dehydratase|nr:hypothetical protein [Deltaproteobacteria bacterium]